VRRSSPDSTSGRSPDSPIRRVHLTPRTGSRDPHRHRFDTVVAAFVAAGRAKDLSPRTIDFYLEGLNSYRRFAGGEERELTLADLDLDVARAWLADFVDRGRRTATVHGRARALRAFGRWIEADGWVRRNPLDRLEMPELKRTIVETFTAEQMTELLAAAPAPLRLVSVRAPRDVAATESTTATGGRRWRGDPDWPRQAFALDFGSMTGNDLRSAISSSDRRHQPAACRAPRAQRS
jgi:hypothetical protein